MFSLNRGARLVVVGLLGFLGCSSPAVDYYHGVRVEDPYRWLEDPAAPAARRWIQKQNARTNAYLEKIPGRSKLRDRLAELWNYEKPGIPIREGERYFFTRNDGLQNQAVLYVAESLEGEPRVLLDPNVIRADGTASLSGWVPSPDGKLLAYGISLAGSDWQEWRVRDVATGEDLADRLQWVKFSSASWTRDGQGFFYSRYEEPRAEASLRAVNYFQKLYYHRIGMPQGQDSLVYEDREHKEWSFDGEVTEDGRYLIIAVRQGTDPRRRIYWRALSEGAQEVKKLLDDFDAAYQFVGNEGPVFWLLTDRAATRSRLVAVDVTAPAGPDGKAVLREVIPEAQETLTQVTVVGGKLVAGYLKDAQSVVRVFSLSGALEKELELPGIGTASGFLGKRESAETFYSFVGFATPATIYRLDVATGQSAVHRQPRLAFDPGEYETRQVFLSSKDGTRIPMFLSMKRGLALDGARPTLLYGYGGFNIPITPSFSVMALVWMEQGGVYAVPNLRGGGEYGEEWHQAGTKLKKQNVFDDFMAAADWLTKNGVTTPAHLAIHGRSNGGLLVGACITQRPELFGAAVPSVGVLDMLRFHKFTIGWAWVSDYGSADNAEELKALLAYSPLHNVRRGTSYPATLVTTGDHDDRVVPAHSFKFAAALQAAQGGEEPILIRIDTDAGHGAGKPTSKSLDEMSDILAFLFREVGSGGGAGASN